MKIKFKSFINATIRKNLKWSVSLLFAIIFANQQIKIANGLTVAGTLTAACAQKIRISIGESVGAVTFYWEINRGTEQNPDWQRFSRTDLSGNEDFFEDDNEIRGIEPGNYRVSVTDEAGNEVRDIRLTLSEPYDLRAGIDFSGLICQGDPSSGLALINFLNGPPPMDWTLTGPNTSLTGQESGSKLAIQDLEVGTYTLDWVSGDECEGQTTFTIVAPSAVTGVINTLNNVSCPGGNDGQVEFTFTGGWEENKDPKIYFTEIVRDGVLVQNWAPQVTSNGVVNRSNLQAGDYTVYYTDRVNEELFIQNLALAPLTNYVFETKRFDCINQLNFTITEPDPFELNLTATVAVCQGDTNGEIAITPSGGTPPYIINFYQGHFDDQDNPVVDNNDMTLLTGSPTTNVSAGQEVKKTDLAAGNYTVLLEDANGCLKAENLNIIENPLGQVDPINDITACSGDLINQPFTTSETTGTTRYEWINDNTAIGLAASGTIDISFPATNTSNAPIAATITVTPFYSNHGVECEGPVETFVITINPEPVGTSSNISVCSNENFDINPQNNIDDAANGGNGVSSSFSWVVTNINGAISGVALNDASTGNITGTVSNTSNTLAVIEYTVTPTANTTGCAGDEFTVTVTVDPEPVGVSTTEDICSDIPFSFDPQDNIDDTGNGGNGVASTFAWEVTATIGSVTGVAIGDLGTGNVTGTLTNTSSTIVTVEYTITPTSAPEGCKGDPFTITVTVNPEPVVSDQTVGPVCSDQSLGVNFNASTSVAAATYNITNLELNGLTVSAGNAIVTNGLTAADLADDAFTNTTNAPVNVVYTLVPLTAGGCEGQSFTVTVTIDPEPFVDPQTTTVCSDEFVGLTLAGDVDGPSVDTYNLIGITDNGLTAGLGNQVIGNGLLSDAIVNDTWENLTSAALDVVYTFVPIGNNGCAGDEFTVTVTVDPEPVGVITTEDVCSDVAFSFDPQDNIDDTGNGGNDVVSTFAWAVTAITGSVTGATIGDSDTGNVTGTLTNTSSTIGTVEYTITPTSAPEGCEGTPFTITVTVNPEPVVSDQIVGPVCSDQPLGANFNSSSTVAAATYNITNLELNGLTVSAGGAAVANGLIDTDLSDDAFTNTTNAPLDVVYTVLPVTAGGCEGDEFTLTVTVNPEPVVLSISDIEVCTGEIVDTIVFSTTNTGGVISYNWEINTDIGLLPLSGVGDIPSFTSQNSGNVPLVATVDVTPTFTANGLSCQGLSESFQIVVNPRPLINDKIVEICSEDTLSIQPLNNIDGDVVPNGTEYSWQVLLPNTNITGATSGSGTIISQTLINTSNEAQVVVYEVTPISNAIGACVGSTFEIEVTVTPRPFLQNQNFETCGGDTFTFSPINNPSNTIIPIGTTYTWTFTDNPNITGETDGINEAQFEQLNLINTTNVDQSVVYNITATAASCSYSFVIELVVKPTPFIPYNSGLTDTRCSGDPFIIQPVNGVPNSSTIVPINTTYTWVVIPNPNISGWSDNSTPVGLIAQQLSNLTNVNQSIEYIVTPYNGTCVGQPFSVLIWIEPKPQIPNHIETLCDGDSFVFAPVNGVFPDSTTIVPDLTLYTWSVNDLSGGLISGYSNGVDQPFIDTGILNNDSNSVQTLIYEVTPTYYVNSNPNMPQCIGDTFTLTVSVNPGVEDNANITNIACSYSPLCGGSIELNPSGVGPYTFNWAYSGTEINAISVPTLQNQYNLCPGDYMVEITDVFGCTYEFSYVIVPPQPVTFNLVSLVDLSCNNISPNCDGYIEVELQGGTLPYSLIEWYTESIPNSGNYDTIVSTGSNQLANACEGNYILKVLDTNACGFTSEIYTVEQTSSPIVINDQISDYNGYGVSCSNTNDGVITVDVLGGSGSFTYTLNPGNIQDSDPSTPNLLEFENLAPGAYTLDIIDSNCPQSITLNYNLTVPTAILSSHVLVSNPISCYGGTATYTITASGGVPPYTGTGNYTLPAGTHDIVITDANGCSTTESIAVVEPTALTVNPAVSSPILCHGDSGIVTITASGGTPPYTGVGNITVSAGNYNYTVTDANGCSYSDTITIDEPDALLYTIDSTTNPTCSPDWSYTNGSICITITGGTNPFPTGTGWTDYGNGSWCLENLSAGDYTIDVRDNNGCTSNGATNITLTRPPAIDAYITSNINADCSTNTITQTNYVFVTGGTPPYEFSWSGGEACNPINPQCMETIVSGTYTAYIHDQESLANGCPPIEVDVVVDLPEIGDAAFSYTTPNSTLCDVLSFSEPITFNNESTGDIVNLTWDFGDGSMDVVGEENPTHVYSKIGTYQVELTVEYPYGCTETYSEVIEITKGYDIVIPNAFTPNGDGINDTIRPVSLCMEQVKISIYDTWGSLLYIEVGENDTIVGWDGTIKGNPAENGNYIIVVEATTYRGETIKLNGPITLIK